MSEFGMTGIAPLMAAGGEEVIGILVVIVMGLLSLAGQFMNKERENKAPPPRPRPRPRPQPQAGPQQRELTGEIEQVKQENDYLLGEIEAVKDKVQEYQGIQESLEEILSTLSDTAQTVETIGEGDTGDGQAN